jgi:(2Fe-2S) ferredoxin
MKEVVETSVTNDMPVNGRPITPAPNGHSDGHTENEEQEQEETNGHSDTPDISGLQINSPPENTKDSAVLQQAQLPSPPTLNPTTLPPSISHTFKTRPIPHKYLILMCSHKTRDARCGQSAPLLRKEFERILRPLGLYRDLHDDRPGGVGIYFINHVGGHKYSANVMIYRRTASQGTSGTELKNEAVQLIWLARVRPEDCENIVKYTVLQGKVVKPERQLRGGFDREKGLTSW